MTHDVIPLEHLQAGDGERRPLQDWITATLISPATEDEPAVYEYALNRIVGGEMVSFRALPPDEAVTMIRRVDHGSATLTYMQYARYTVTAPKPPEAGYVCFELAGHAQAVNSVASAVDRLFRAEAPYGDYALVYESWPEQDFVIDAETQSLAAAGPERSFLAQ